MILYHFPPSPFARRVRLMLAHKGLSAELRDARANHTHTEAMHRLSPFHTVPVLLDDERVIFDSGAIAHYLDRKQPDPPLWPPGLAGAEAFRLAALTDGVINILSDLGMRYAPLHENTNFPVVRTIMVGRVERALDMLATEVTTRGLDSGPLCGDSWGAADIAVYTMVAWLEGLPIRAATFPPVRGVVSLGWTLPAVLSTWANQHRQRPDVLALG
jgi:glutathione S-transferase